MEWIQNERSKSTTTKIIIIINDSFSIQTSIENGNLQAEKRRPSNRIPSYRTLRVFTAVFSIESVFNNNNTCYTVYLVLSIEILKTNSTMNKLSLRVSTCGLLLACIATVATAFSVPKGAAPISNRRGFASSVASVVAGTSALLIDPSLTNADGSVVAPASPLEVYEDKNCKFSVSVPSEWVKTEQTLPDRRKIVLYFKPESNQKTLMFIAYTPTRDDFTSLGSFGVSAKHVGFSLSRKKQI